MASEERETPSQKLHKYVFSTQSKLIADLLFFFRLQKNLMNAAQIYSTTSQPKVGAIRCQIIIIIGGGRESVLEY